jgi:hypothetical protein
MNLTQTVFFLSCLAGIYAEGRVSALVGKFTSGSVANVNSATRQRTQALVKKGSVRGLVNQFDKLSPKRTDFLKSKSELTRSMIHCLTDLAVMKDVLESSCPLDFADNISEINNAIKSVEREERKIRGLNVENADEARLDFYLKTINGAKSLVSEIQEDILSQATEAREAANECSFQRQLSLEMYETLKTQAPKLGDQLYRIVIEHYNSEEEAPETLAEQMQLAQERKISELASEGFLMSQVDLPTKEYLMKLSTEDIKEEIDAAQIKFSKARDIFDKCLDLMAEYQTTPLPDSAYMEPPKA